MKNRNEYKQMKIRIIIFVSCLFFSLNLFSQNDSIEQKHWHGNLFGVSAFYALQIPFGELSERFGFNSDIGAHAFYIFSNDITLGLEYSYMFGNKLKGDALHILDKLKTDNGNIINEKGEYASYVLSERGFFGGIKLGKIIYLQKKNKIGLYTNIGVGLLQHKIRIDVDGNNVPGLYGNYAKGYDRLTNGLTLNQFLGFTYMPLYSPINFYIGVELCEGWTMNRRDFNFDTYEKDDHLRHDYLFGIKAGWIITIYKQNVKQYYYF